MRAELKFFDWKQSFLTALVDHFISNRKDDLVDLSDCLIIFPGSRAARRFTELMLLECQRLKLRFIPAKFATLGDLPEYLISSANPVASNFQSLSAWSNALKKVSPEILSVISPQLKDSDRLSSFIPTANYLQHLYDEISAAALSFAGIANILPKIYESQIKRWQALDCIYQEYLRELHSINLEDRHYARLHAALETEHKDKIILAGCVDLNQTVQNILHKYDGDLEIFVFAAEAYRNCFNDLGAIIPARWQRVKLDWENSQLAVAQTEVEQLKMLLHDLDLIRSVYSDEVTILSCNQELIPNIIYQLGQAGVPVRYGSGHPASNSELYYLLLDLRAYLQYSSFKNLAALLRIPAISKIISDKYEILTSDLIKLFDEYQTAHLQDYLTSHLPAASSVIQDVVKFVHSLFKPLKNIKNANDFALAFKSLIEKLYGSQKFHSYNLVDREKILAFELLNKILLELSQLISKSDHDSFYFIELIINRFAKSAIPSAPQNNPTEVIGWLEALFDDTPQIFITSFNEEYVPSIIVSDLFLPNQLRSLLGLPDSHYRLARDNYILKAILESHTKTYIYLAKNGLNKDPLLPSKLIYNCDDELMISRVADFFCKDLPQLHASANLAEVVYSRPEIKLINNRDVVSVSAFKTFLNCPADFYIQQVCKLREVNDQARELSAPQTGEIIHQVLFKTLSAEKIYSSADQLFDNLDRNLNDIIIHNFSDTTFASVKLQVSRIRRRLKLFSDWQFAWQQTGSQIRELEWGFDEKDLTVESPAGQLGVRGRIDRIDYNPETKTWYILDYKTSTKNRSVDQFYFKSKQWIDLQLPCYNRVWQTKIAADEKIKLGLVCITGEEVEYQEADWDAGKLTSADQCLSQVVARILSSDFNSTAQELSKSYYPLASKLISNKRLA